MNYFDFLAIAVLFGFMFLGFLKGFVRESIGLFSLTFSFILSFSFYVQLSGFIDNYTVISSGFIKVVSFFAIWFIAQLISFILFIFLYPKIPKELHEGDWNRWGGLAPAFVKGLIALIFIFSFLNIFPLNGHYKGLVNESWVGKQSLGISDKVADYIEDIFGTALDETSSFVTVEKGSNEFIDLDFNVNDSKVDAASESRMLELVNDERIALGLEPLVMDDSLRNLARAHSTDMFTRGYFSHITPEGITPFDRMENAGIDYMIAGENLALAPTVDTAHEGLMNSAGHRANILTPEFRKIGIGVMDGGVRGKMFSQEFSN
jgi:uncharacterized protein YkwD